MSNKRPTCSSYLSVLKSFDSSISVTFESQCLGGDLKIFLTILGSLIIFLKIYNSLTMATNLVLISLMLSSSSFLNISKSCIRVLVLFLYLCCFCTSNLPYLSYDMSLGECPDPSKFTITQNIKQGVKNFFIFFSRFSWSCLQ